MQVIEIGPIELAAASGFVLVSGLLALWLRVGLTWT